jgi:guanylate kinase
MPTRLTVLSGPSGVGKSSVVAEVRELYPHVWVSVSATTRPRRPGETNGVEYHFVTRDEFERMVADGEFLEYAEFAGNLYGTPLAPLRQRLDEGIASLLEIELYGARQVREALPDALLVFLKPPSWEELERRLVGRGTEPDEVIEARLAQGRVELAAESEFDRVVVNHDVGRAAAELVGLMVDGAS